MTGDLNYDKLVYPNPANIFPASRLGPEEAGYEVSYCISFNSYLKLECVSHN